MIIYKFYIFEVFDYSPLDLLWKPVRNLSKKLDSYFRGLKVLEY